MQAPQESDPTNNSRRDLTSLSDEEALELLTSNRTVAERYQKMCAARLEEYKGLVENAFNERLTELEEYIRTWKQKVEGVLSNAAIMGCQPPKLTNDQEQILNEDHASIASFRSAPCSIVVSNTWHTPTTELTPLPQFRPKSLGNANGPTPGLTKEEIRDVAQHLMIRMVSEGLSERLYSLNSEPFRGLVLRHGEGQLSPLATCESGKASRAPRFSPDSVIFQPTYKNIRTIWHIYWRLKQRQDELVALSKRHNGDLSPYARDTFGNTNPAFDAHFPVDKSPLQLQIVHLPHNRPKGTKYKASDINKFFHNEVKRDVSLARRSHDGVKNLVEYRKLDTYQLTSEPGDDIIVWETFINYRVIYLILDSLLQEEQSSIVNECRALAGPNSSTQISIPGTSSSSCDVEKDSNVETKATKVLRIVQDKSQQQKNSAQRKRKRSKEPTPPKKVQIPKAPIVPLKKGDSFSMTRSGTPYRLNRSSDNWCYETSSEYKAMKQLGKRSRSSGGSKTPPAKRAKIEKSTAALNLGISTNDLENQNLFGASNSKGNDVECGPESFGFDATTMNGQSGTTSLDGQKSADEQRLTQSTPNSTEGANSLANEWGRSLEFMKQASDAIIREQMARDTFLIGDSDLGVMPELAAVCPHHERDSGGKDGEIVPKAISPVCSTTQQAQSLTDQPDSPPQEKTQRSKSGEGLSPLSLTLQRVSDALQQSLSSRRQPTASELSTLEQQNANDEDPICPLETGGQCSRRHEKTQFRAGSLHELYPLLVRGWSHASQ